MSDEPDHDSRTEEPTEKKIRDALERGNIPVSRDVSQVSFLIGTLALLGLVIPSRVRDLVAGLTHMIDDPVGWRVEQGDDALILLANLWVVAALFVAPIVVVVAASGLVGSFIQNAPRMVFDRLRPDLTRISIKSGLRRLASPRAWIEFVKASTKLLAMIGVCGYSIWADRDRLVELIWVDIGLLPGTIVAHVRSLVVAMAIVATAIAAADVVWTKRLWRRDQRMSKQEIKEEVRQAEGDRFMKARLRSIRLDRSRKRMLAAVPKATMVVANPTHYAVAMRYVYGQAAAPTVVAKGADLIALKIREIAENSGIPVIENRALARSLYDAVEVEQAIPAEFYHAVAEIVHLLRSKSGGRGRVFASSGQSAGA